jgi:hypothetical protein
VGERGALGRLEVGAALGSLLADVMAGMGGDDAGEDREAGDGLGEEHDGQCR